jgi:CYTH domain-containing protein
MGTEIERKFLLASDEWRTLTEGVLYRQGYLSSDKERTVRVRVIDRQGYLTVKGAGVGNSRQEFEYEIPLQDAEEMLNELCIKPLIEKKRYTIEYNGCTWEIDEFLGENSGLIIAEIELESEEQSFDLPAWIGREVSGDPRYFNSNLAENPYCDWRE